MDNYAQTYGNRFNKPYFQPYFFNKKTLVAKFPTQKQPYYLIKNIVSFFRVLLCFS
jgi:hypothetical protein